MQAHPFLQLVRAPSSTPLQAHHALHAPLINPASSEGRSSQPRPLAMSTNAVRSSSSPSLNGHAIRDDGVVQSSAPTHYSTVSGASLTSDVPLNIPSAISPSYPHSLGSSAPIRPTSTVASSTFVSGSGALSFASSSNSRDTPLPPLQPIDTTRLPPLTHRGHAAIVR